MKLSLLCFILLLAGCSTFFPATPKFPNAAPTAMEKCKPLQVITDPNIALSGVVKSVVENYTTHHECFAKNDAWAEWYNTQKKIYENIK